MPVRVAQPWLGLRERLAVDRVLRSGRLAQGVQVAKFETEFARLVAGRDCVAVNSGTSGLHLGLLAHQFGAGDEVIVPSFTFAATVNAILLAGATPVFADIERDTFNIDPSDVLRKVTDRTKAVMLVHLFGHPARVPDGWDRWVFEDASQAHGAQTPAGPAGSLGQFGVFSFYPTKNMTAGEGGMVVTSPERATTVRSLRNQGMLVQYENELVGFNNRMTDIHAAIGRVQLTRLDRWTRQRQDNAQFLTDHLDGVATPVVRDGFSHVFHQFTVRIPQDRDRFRTALLDEFGVESGVYYPTPVHRLPSMRHLLDVDLPVTEQAAREVLSLPVHPHLSRRDLETVVEGVNRLAKAGG
jgi:dTDP-4-amino-4,6-dideoxygalactose transaminase